MDEDLTTSMQVAGDIPAEVVLDERRYGLPEWRRNRYSYWHLLDGKYSMISARYEGVLYAVTPEQHKTWSRMTIIRRENYGSKPLRKFTDWVRTVRLERRLNRLSTKGSSLET